MRNAIRKLKTWMRSEQGQNTVEYLLMLAVVVAVALILGRLFKAQIGNIFTRILDLINGSITSIGTPG